MSGKYLIIGLGNPGREYAQTRHNVGFMVIDELAQGYQLGDFTFERKALTVSGLINQKRVILAKPQTYMNLSGESVRALVDYYNVELEQLIVVHDDLDLPLGTLRLRMTGGHGGQNGIRNMILHLGTKDFARVRFGIGRPPGRMKPRDYVLQPFRGDNAILAKEVIANAVKAIELWLKEGIEPAMQHYNGNVNDGKGKPKKSNLKEDLQIAQRAHELNPKDPKPLQQMAKLQKKLRQVDEAVRTHLLLAELYRDMGNVKGQLAEWEVAINMRPELIELREELAATYEETENTKRAAQTWIRLGEYHEKQGDTEAALLAIGEALRINPQHPKAVHLETTFRNKLTM